MLAYTFNSTLTQRALIERDEATADKWGAETKSERKVIAEVACLFSPFVQQSRSRSEERATPVRTIAEIPALLIVPVGTDVTERDWIKEVIDAKGARLIDGPFRVIGVVPYEDHMELALERP